MYKGKSKLKIQYGFMIIFMLLVGVEIILLMVLFMFLRIFSWMTFHKIQILASFFLPSSMAMPLILFPP